MTALWVRSPAGSRGSIYFVLLVLVIVWPTTWMVIKINLHGMPPLLGAAARFLIAGLAFAALALMRGMPLRVRSDQIGLVGLTAATMFALPYGLLYVGETQISSGVAAVLSGTLPLFTALIARRLLPNESVGWRNALGVCLGIAGLVLVFRGELEIRSGILVIGALIVTGLGPLFGAIGQAANRVARGRIATPVLLAWSMGAAGATLLVVGLGVGQRNITWDFRTIGSTLYLAIPGSVIPFASLIWLLHRVRAFSVSLLNLVLPVMAVLEGWALYGEQLNASILIGTTVVVAGVAAAGGFLRLPFSSRPLSAPRIPAVTAAAKVEGDRHV